MLTVKTYLGPSSVHGIGLFADEKIPAGTVVWKVNNEFNRIFNEKNFLSICLDADDLSLKHLLNSSYRRNGSYYYLTDNARFINHSDNEPNIIFMDDQTEIAFRDIYPDEEILENYLDAYDPDDYFFQEFILPDPRIYIINLFLKGAGDVNRKNVS